MIDRDYVASTSELLAAAEAIADDWERLGASGHLLAVNLDTEERLGFDIEQSIPIVSVVKVPIALCVLDQIAHGTLDAAQQISFTGQTASLGPTGVAAFRHPGSLAVADLVMLMLTISDNAAADLLLDLVGVEQVNASLAEWGCSDIRIRHPLQQIFDSVSEAANGDPHVALDLAIDPQRTGARSLDVLDPERANTGTARALVAFLQDIWLDRIAVPPATAELRRLMAMQVYHHRLSSDLRSDSIRVSGKTGTFLNLRHEIGVIESDTGDRIAIAALTRSVRPARIAHDIDLGIGAAARTAFEALRA